MLDPKFIRENIETVAHAIKVKGVDVDLGRFLELDDEIRACTARIVDLRTRRNKISDRFPKSDAHQKKALSDESKSIGAELDRHEQTLRVARAQFRELSLVMPGIPDPTAPIGPDALSNRVVKTVGTPPVFDFKPLDHVDIVKKRGWADLDRPAQISGRRTFALKGDLVLLDMAMMGYALSRMQAEGFTPITIPPFARRAAFEGTGHFPLGEEEAYELPRDDLFLIGTSEVVLNAFHGGEILDEADLPILYAGYSSCFRREAGSGGRDVRGFLRVHHFTKVEQFVICRNDAGQSREWHDRLLAISESLLAGLELPYQIVECSTGDMGLGKFRMNDIESWVPSLETYRETHSCSTLHDWQSRRTNTRYRDADTGEIVFAHTLNNTALATPRVFASFLEVHQQADGRVYVPDALRPFLNGRTYL